jgi:uncharacterized protein (DUF2147 family)
MKKFLMVLAVLLGGALGVSAQNDKADNIIGTYICGTGLDAYKVKIFKEADATYTVQVIWVADRVDKNGKVYLDDKNPDKALRSTPIDQVVLIRGLKYIPAKKHWGDAKIYDPNRGIRVKATLSFDSPTVLKVRGTVLGIGETEVWTRVE